MPDSIASNIVTATPGPQPQTWLQANVAPLVALLAVGGGLYIMAWGTDNKAAIMGPIVMAIIGYYFGTGAGSQAKDKIIASLSGNGK
jgi:hypothetical protein